MGKAKKAARKALRADERTTHAAARKHDALPMRLAQRASDIADQPPLIALSSATIAVGVMLRSVRMTRTGIRMLASHLLATGIKTVLKGAVDRTRPSRALKEGHRAGKGRGTDDTSLNSFPSGHTAGAVAVAQAVAAESTYAGLPVQAAALGVAALQPSQGKHYWSDVVAGAVIGLAAERLVDVAVRQLFAPVSPDWVEECGARPS